MSSDRKIEANRQNAQASTGPNTEEGKAKSSQNARKHGLSSSSLFLPPDRLNEFKALFSDYFSELRPVGLLQTHYFEQLIHAKWNLDIAYQLHARALADLDEKRITAAARYIAQFERSFAQAHKALKTEQTDLALRALPQNEPIADLPGACQIKIIGNEATKLTRHDPHARQQALTAVARAFAPFENTQPAPMPTDQTA